MKKISFCITCKNRFHQIVKTLPDNLHDNRRLADEVEFILVDFGSSDGLKEWVLNQFSEELKSGYLKFFHTEQMKTWDCSIAKNTAHRYAAGEILVNLDCDNFTGPEGAKFVMDCFNSHADHIILHQFSGDGDDGSYGRISLLKEHFKLLGGYDESFNPMGYQDADLIQRARELGLSYILKPQPLFNKAIKNSKSESIRFTSSKKNYATMCSENRSLSEQNLLLGKIIANNGKFGLKNLQRF